MAETGDEAQLKDLIAREHGTFLTHFTEFEREQQKLLADYAEKLVALKLEIVRSNLAR